MNEQIKEYQKQLQRDIDRFSGMLEDAKKELQKCIERPDYTIIDFGIAKYGERITVIMAQLQILQYQQHTFNAIFESDN